MIFFIVMIHMRCRLVYSRLAMNSDNFNNFTCKAQLVLFKQSRPVGKFIFGQ